MAETRIDLLTDEDLAFIQQEGLPMDPEPLLFIEGTDGSLTLTPKGEQYVRHACQLHEVEFASIDVTSEDALLRACDLFNDKIMSKAAAQLAEDLSAGRIPHQQRDYIQALLSGDMDRSAEAAKRLSAAEKAGTNVIPVTFSR